MYNIETISNNLHDKYDNNPINKLVISININKDGSVDVNKVNKSIIDYIDSLSYDNLFDKKDDLIGESEKLHDIYKIIRSKKELSTKKNKSVYNERIKFHNLKSDIVNNYSNSIGVSLPKSETDQEGSGIKIYTPSTLLTRLPILMGQLETGNNSIGLLNEIRQTISLLYRNNKITKRLYISLLKYCCKKIKSITAEVCISYNNHVSLRNVQLFKYFFIVTAKSFIIINIFNMHSYFRYFTVYFCIR